MCISADLTSCGAVWRRQELRLCSAPLRSTAEDRGQRTHSADTSAGVPAEVGHRVQTRFLLVFTEKETNLLGKIGKSRDAGGRRSSAVWVCLHGHFCKVKIYFLSFLMRHRGVYFWTISSKLLMTGLPPCVRACACARAIVCAG